MTRSIRCGRARCRGSANKRCTISAGGISSRTSPAHVVSRRSLRCQRFGPSSRAGRKRADVIAHGDSSRDTRGVVGDRMVPDLVFLLRFQQPSSLALPGIEHLCPTTLTAQGPPTTSCPSERRRRLKNFSAFPLAALLPLELIRYQPGRTRRRPTNRKDSTNERDPVLHSRQPHPRS